MEEPDATVAEMSTAKIWGLIVLGLALLVAGGEMLVTGAVQIARLLGISEAVIGITIVAVGTSLPELATSAVAAIKKEADIAVGNIIGSNVFNLLSILGITALIHPLDSSGFGLVDLGMMLGLTLLIWPMMRLGYQINRLEGGAAAGHVCGVSGLAAGLVRQLFLLNQPHRPFIAIIDGGTALVIGEQTQVPDCGIDVQVGRMGFRNCDGLSVQS